MAAAGHHVKTLLAKASSHQPYGKHSKRWTEIEIYRLAGGGYEAKTIGRSTRPGESDRLREIECPTALEVLDALTGTGKLTNLATDVLGAAAAADDVFASQLGDRHLVEHLEDLPAGILSALAPGLSLFELERDGDRAVRFVGMKIGHGRSHHDSSPWLEVDVYATKMGKYATYKTSRTADELLTAAFHLVDDGDAALRSLIRPQTGWIEDAVVDALREAAAKDQRFARSLGDALDPARLRDLVAAVPAIPRGYRPVLEHLSTGARVIEQLDENGDGAGVCWEIESPDSPRLPRGMFVWLSRRRLVRCVFEGERSQTWSISKLGEAALSAGRRNGG